MKRLTVIFLPICIFSFIAFGVSVFFFGTARRGRSTSTAEIVDIGESVVYLQPGSLNEQYEHIKAYMALGDLVIEPSPDGQTMIYVDDNIKDYVTVDSSGSTLEINLDWSWDPKDTEFWNNLQKLIRGELSGNVVVYVPDRTYSSVELDVGAGYITVHDIRAEDVDINVSAGTLYYGNPYDNIIDSLDIHVSAGECIIEGARTHEYDLTLSAGSLNIDGLSGEGDISVSAGVADIGYSSFEGADVDVSAGSLYMYLPSDSSAEIYCDKSAGSVTVITANGVSRSLGDDEVYTVGDGGHTLKASVSAGSINISLAAGEYNIVDAVVIDSSSGVQTTTMWDTVWWEVPEAPLAPEAPEAPRAPSFAVTTMIPEDQIISSERVAEYQTGLSSVTFREYPGSSGEVRLITV